MLTVPAVLQRLMMTEGYYITTCPVHAWTEMVSEEYLITTLSVATECCQNLHCDL